MARPVRIEQSDIERAGEAMLLLITRSTYETLARQAEAEGTTPGVVLQKAIAEYLGKHGSEDVLGYLRQVAEGYHR